MPTPKNNGGSKTAVEVKVTFDAERHVVTITDADGTSTVYPDRALTQATAERFAAQYNGQSVPIADLEEAFACDDPENAESHVIKRLQTIAKQMLGEDRQLILIRAYGVNGGGRKVGFRFAPADDPEAQDQLIDAMIRAQAARARATERHTRLIEAAKKHGIAVPE